MCAAHGAGKAGGERERETCDPSNRCVICEMRSRRRVRVVSDDDFETVSPADVMRNQLVSCLGLYHGLLP